jgi:hypothetical protein
LSIWETISGYCSARSGYAGFPIEGIPIVDDLILFRYFKEGWHSWGAVTEGNKLMPLAEANFFGNHAEAIANLPSYLEKPPQVTRYLPYLTKENRILVESQGDNKRLLAEEYEVVYNAKDLRSEAAEQLKKNAKKASG